jgi:hypothetical protein
MTSLPGAYRSCEKGDDLLLDIGNIEFSLMVPRKLSRRLETLSKTQAEALSVFGYRVDTCGGLTAYRLLKPRLALYCVTRCGLSGKLLYDKKMVRHFSCWPTMVPSPIYLRWHGPPFSIAFLNWKNWCLR